MVGWLHYCGSEVGQNFMVTGVCGGGRYSPHGSLEAKPTNQTKKWQEEAKVRGTLQKHTSSDLVPLPKPHLLTFLSPPNNAIKLIIRLIHAGNQSPHDPITPQTPHLQTLLALGTKPLIQELFGGGTLYI
jgi:hypothetical protein